ncbi:hypothetical protein BH11CYA1_BH11CYA1_48260 [soil metagenome]
MNCGRCSTKIEETGACPKCSTSGREQTDEDRRDRVLFSIIQAAQESDLPWSENEEAVAFAEKFKILPEEIDEIVNYRKFRWYTPLLELSEEQNRLVQETIDLGLYFRRNETGPYRHGFFVCKPDTTKGNTRPDSKCGYGDIDNLSQTDAPVSWIYPDPDGTWNFQVSVYVPGPGPGDFINNHPTMEDAITDLRDYYFGDPVRMNPPDMKSKRTK